MGLGISRINADSQWNPGAVSTLVGAEKEDMCVCVCVYLMRLWKKVSLEEETDGAEGGE